MPPEQRHPGASVVRYPRNQTLQQHRLIRRGDTAVLVLCGVFDLAGREQFGTAVRQLLHPPTAGRIEIDVNDLWLLDASGIRLLVQARSRTPAPPACTCT